MCEENKMQIKKRFGARSFVDYLHLNDVYSIGTKPKKQQQVFLKGGSGYVYKTPPAEKKTADIQKSYSVNQPGPWKHFYDGYHDSRSFRWSAKEAPRVSTGGDGLIENWWGEHHRQAANVRARAAERDVYQARVDAANLYRNNQNDLRLQQIQIRDQMAQVNRQILEAQAAVEIAAAAHQAGIDAAVLQEKMLTKKAIEWWKNKKLKKHINTRIELKKLGLPQCCG